MARRCPICKKELPLEAEHRPFCSDRCKTIDLGRWLNEEYRISRPMTEDDLMSAELGLEPGADHDQS